MSATAQLSKLAELRAKTDRELVGVIAAMAKLGSPTKKGTVAYRKGEVG
jgi:hypothetical protein